MNVTPTPGLAMTAGMVAGLGGMPVIGRWLDRGARNAGLGLGAHRESLI
jgi:hypothetical protein